MNKVIIQNLATEPYNRASIFKAFFAIELAINKIIDGFLFNTRLITASYTATTSDSVILANATSGAITIALPQALTCESKRFTFKKTDVSANAVIIDADGAETIDGVATVSLPAQYDGVEIVSQGGAWWIVSLV